MVFDMFVKDLKMKEKVSIKRWKYLILCLVAVIIALLLIFNPGSSIFVYLKITGIYLVVVSVLHFVDYFKLFKK